MIRFTRLFIAIALGILISSCSKDDGGSNSLLGIDNGGGGGGGTTSVTFTVALVQDQQQQTYFEFKPSTSVVVAQVTANCAAAGVNNQVVQGDGTTVYSQTTPFYIGPATGLQQGQQWTFAIQGKLGSAQGQAYNVNTNFTVP